MKVFDASYPKADILAEALNHARAEETGLHVPPIREVTVIDGKWTIITGYIKGKNMAQFMAEHPERKNELLRRFVDLQREMHGCPCPLFPDLREKMHRKISLTDLDAATRDDLHTRLDSMPAEHRLCHGDFNPSNIILAEDGALYILDWAHAAQGNALADVARTYLLFWLAGDIDGAEKYLRIRCDGNEAERRTIREWMSVVAAEQLVNGNAREREFLRSWIPVSGDSHTERKAYSTTQ